MIDESLNEANVDDMLKSLRPDLRARLEEFGEVGFKLEMLLNLYRECDKEKLMTYVIHMMLTKFEGRMLIGDTPKVDKYLALHGEIREWIYNRPANSDKTLN